MEKEKLKELFDLEQQLGINEKNRFHNSEEGRKQYEALFENHHSCNDIKSEETTEELSIKLERIINKRKEEAIDQLKTRINELKTTIENMKAIACEKIEPINGITSVDYPNDNETELITVTEEVYSGCFSEITKTKCCGIAPITNENYCPNCGRKIKK